MSARRPRRSDIFFFQAEDGIRDDLVTGVQTCALPICLEGPLPAGLARTAAGSDRLRVLETNFHRSEERRVGKECRAWWAAYESKEKWPHQIRREIDRLAGDGVWRGY